MYASIHRPTYIKTRLSLYVYMGMYVCIYIYTYMYLYVYVHVYIYIYIYIYWAVPRIVSDLLDQYANRQRASTYAPQMLKHARSE